MDEIILTLKEELQVKLNKEMWPRHIKLPDVENKIHVVTGMRRTGKTCFLLKTIKNLLEDGIPFIRILHVNFEDDRLQPMDQLGLAGLIDGFYRLFPENHDHLCHFFFDEIQNVEGWSTVLRRIFDTKTVKLYVTGSSAKLLSKEIGTALRGRSITTEMWPLDFMEHPAIENFPEKMGAWSLDKFRPVLDDFIEKGGFPETIYYDDPVRRQVLQDYVSIVIYRDIIERHKISNTVLVKRVIRAMLHSVGRQLSISKLYNDLKSQGVKASKNTLYEYIEYIKDTYLAYTVPLFSESIRKVQSNPRKIYAVDTGLVTAFTLKINRNAGQLFENLVFQALRRKTDEIYYYITKDRHEVDFVTKTLDGEFKLFQVCYDMTEENTYEREKRALMTAENETGLKGHIITPENYIWFLNSL